MGISVAEEAYIVPFILIHLQFCAGGLSEIPEGKRKEHFTEAKSYLWTMQKYLFKINIYWRVAPGSGRRALKSRQHEKN